jgi:FixJ family two-component response regulator
MTMVTGNAKTSGQPLAEARIFIFDRDDDVRDSLKVLLESNGLVIEAFADRMEFLTAATSRPADCLILGFNRLIVEGLEILAALQRSQVRSPAIFVVGGGNALSRASALGAGADAYLERPIEESTLIRALVDALPKKQTLALNQSKQDRAS